MPNNSAETVIAATGSVWVAPVGTAFPATPTTAPSPTWKELGFISEDGVKFQPSMSVVDFKAWQSYYPIRSQINERSLKIAMALKQWNEVTLPLAFGGGTITGAGPYTYTPPATTDAIDERALLVRWKDGPTRNYDLRVLRVMATDLGEVGLARAKISDLQVSFMLHDDGDDATAPWTILTDDANYA